MLPAYGRDRVRQVGDRFVLLSMIPKPWTPRTPKSGTHSEYPGTTVLWEEQYLEVVEAVPTESGGARYVLMAWREDHTIRTFERYDEESERLREEDYRRAQSQRRNSVLSRLSGMLLGNLPEPAQSHLQNEVGVVPSRMTILSCALPLVLFMLLASIAVGAAIRHQPSPIPVPLLVLSGMLVCESLIRFFVAMSQNRGMGSLLGVLAYSAWWLIRRGRTAFPPPWGRPGGGDAVFTLPAPENVAFQDSLQMRAPLLTLLSRPEQELIARRYGVDYRSNAYGLTWCILFFAVLGVVSTWPKVSSGGGVVPLLSFLLALYVSGEQVVRLMTLRQRPVGSIFGAIVRPFMRDLLEQR